MDVCKNESHIHVSQIQLSEKIGFSTMLQQNIFDGMAKYFIAET